MTLLEQLQDLTTDDPCLAAMAQGYCDAAFGAYMPEDAARDGQYQAYDLGFNASAETMQRHLDQQGKQQ